MGLAPGPAMSSHGSPTGRGTLRSPQIETLNGEFRNWRPPATDPLGSSRPSWTWRMFQDPCGNQTLCHALYGKGWAGV